MSEHMSDAAFGKVFAIMIAGMVALTILLIILAYAVGGEMGSQMSDVQIMEKDKETVARVQPVASMAIGEVAEQPAMASAEAMSGERVYQTACVACHGAGVAGAPKHGDTAAWETRMAQGIEALYDHAINGFNAMPAKGGNTSLSDDSVKAAVDYMIGRESAAPAQTEAAASETSAETAAVAAESAATTSTADGAAVYQASCSICHDAGVAGAPRPGQAADWEQRLGKGIDTLHASALNGLNAMPPKGGNPVLSDDDVRAAVDHMVGSVSQ